MGILDADNAQLQAQRVCYIAALQLGGRTITHLPKSPTRLMLKVREDHDSTRVYFSDKDVLWRRHRAVITGAVK